MIDLCKLFDNENGKISIEDLKLVINSLEQECSNQYLEKLTEYQEGNNKTNEYLLKECCYYDGKRSAFHTISSLLFRLDITGKKEGRDTNFKIGDRVRFRLWEDMEEDYGLDRDGNIKCEVPSEWPFLRAMNGLCGKRATIENIQNTDVYLTDFSETVDEKDTTWFFSTYMIEKIN